MFCIPEAIVITPFIPSELYVRVECDMKDESGNLIYPGAWIEARKNLSIGERMVLVDALDAIDMDRDERHEPFIERAEAVDAEMEALDLKTIEGRRAQREMVRRQKAALREQRDLNNELTTRQRELIAPYIRAWNLHNPDGSPLEPPSVGGAAVLEQVPQDLVSWMVLICQNAYRLGKSLGRSTSTPSANGPEPTQELTNVGPQVISTSSSRRSRRKSS